MSVLIAVALTLVVIALITVAVFVVCTSLVERRERLLALQRALVMQCADQRMRAASQQAIRAFSDIVSHERGFR